MRRDIFTSLFMVVLFVGMAFVGTSCGTNDDDIQRMIDEALKKNNQQLEFTQWKIVNVDVKKENWVWNEEKKCYQAAAELSELTEFIYEKGAVLAYVFIGEKEQTEVQKPLPFVHTYGDKNPPYTETISHDVQFKSGGVEKPTVAFFVQSSDLSKGVQYDYAFRVVLIW